MIDLLALSIGIGLIIALLFSEFFGLVAAGMIIPGYLALTLTQPLTVLFIFLIGFITFLIMRSVSSYLLLFGRRRTALTLLVAFLLSMLIRSLLTVYQGGTLFGETYQVVGYIIPGLIALSIDRQGVIETVTMTLTCAVIVRLILILLVGSALI